ncbi:MAG: hypothetical protein AB7M12_11160 [Hyphomonadaceae bacterium]
MNAKILDVTEAAEALIAEAVLERTATPGLYRSVLLAQRAVFSAGGAEKVDPALLDRLAAQIALASEANCALFVVPEGASSAREVAVRLGSVPLTTMAHLLMLHQRGRLTAGAVNRDVWSQVVTNQQTKVGLKA